MLSSVYVTAASADAIEQVSADIEAARLPARPSRPRPTSRRASLGSLATASSLVAGLGTWLSVLVLAVAFLIAVLFTVSGVARRTRGGRHPQGDRLVQPSGAPPGHGRVACAGPHRRHSALGGIAIVNLIAPTLSTGTARC